MAYLLMLLRIPIGLTHFRAGDYPDPPRKVISRQILKAREFRLGKSRAHSAKPEYVAAEGHQSAAIARKVERAS